MKKFLALTLALVMALSLVACGGGKTEEPAKTDAPAKTEEPAKTEGDTYKVGVVLPMTGGSARNGEVQYEGIKLLADYYNEQGGIKSMNGMKIELVLADSAGDPTTGASETERLINNEKVDALMGPYNSSVGAVMQPLAEKYGVPFIVTNCTANNVMMSDGDLKYTFRGNITQSFSVNLWWGLIDFLNTMQPADNQMDKFAIVYENTDYGQGVVDNFGNCLTYAGYELAVCESFETGTADFSSTINKIKAADVDWVIPAMYTSDAQLFLQQYREYGVEAAIIWDGGGASTDEFVKNVGEFAQNNLCTVGWSIDRLSQAYDPELAQAMNEKHNADVTGDFTENSAWGWTGMGILIDALERAGTKDKDAVAQALAETNISGDHLALLFVPWWETITFEDVELWDGSAVVQNQNPTAMCVFAQLQGDKYVSVYPDFEGNPIVWPPVG